MQTHINSGSRHSIIHRAHKPTPTPNQTQRQSILYVHYRWRVKYQCWRAAKPFDEFNELWYAGVHACICACMSIVLGGKRIIQMNRTWVRAHITAWINNMSYTNCPGCIDTVVERVFSRHFTSVSYVIQLYLVEGSITFFRASWMFSCECFREHYMLYTHLPQI